MLISQKKRNTGDFLIVQHRLYKSIFWIGYFAVLITTFIPIAGELNKIHIGPDAFQIRLDHLLHFAVYFIICIYFLAGLKRGLCLFSKNSMVKFILWVLFLGTVTELVQLWVPERAFNPMDWVANVAGVAIGLIVIVSAGKS